MILVRDIVSFILRHRHNGKAFNHGETPLELQDIICDYIARECCVVDADWMGNIRGVILGKIFIAEKKIHIDGILTVDKNSMKKFAEWLQMRYKEEGWTLTAKRNDKFIEYPVRILSKILKQ